MSDLSRRSTAPAHDPEREALVKSLDAARVHYRAFMEVVAGRPPCWADIPAALRLMQLQGFRDRAYRALAAHDQARGPTVPTRTASGYSNQAAPDE